MTVINKESAHSILAIYADHYTNIMQSCNDMSLNLEGYAVANLDKRCTTGNSNEQRTNQNINFLKCKTARTISVKKVCITRTEHIIKKLSNIFKNTKSSRTPRHIILA